MKFLACLFLAGACAWGQFFPFPGPARVFSTSSVATPTDSPGAGTYSSTQSVTLSDSTSGATICYTIDGSTPGASTPGTCNSSPTTTYSGAISVATTTTVKAIGTKSGLTNSGVLTSVYTITVGPTLCTSGSGSGKFNYTISSIDTSACGSNNLIVVGIGWNGNGVSPLIPSTSSFSDSVSNTYQESNYIRSESNYYATVTMFVCRACTLSSTHTWTLSDTGAHYSVLMVEVFKDVTEVGTINWNTGVSNWALTTYGLGVYGLGDFAVAADANSYKSRIAGNQNNTPPVSSTQWVRNDSYNAASLVASIQPGSLTPSSTFTNSIVVVVMACNSACVSPGISTLTATSAINDVGVSNIGGLMGYIVQGSSAVNPTVSWTGSSYAAVAMVVF